MSSDAPITVEPVAVEPVGPPSVEPTRDYLGFECHNCQQFFSIVGPLDPVQIPPDQPVTIGSRAPLHGKCPHCQHEADYPVAELQRRSMA